MKRWSKRLPLPWSTRASRRAALRNRLLLSVVTGTAVALVVRAVQGRKAAAPAVPAPSKEWPPLPDLAATEAATTPAPVAPPSTERAEPAPSALVDSPSAGDEIGTAESAPPSSGIGEHTTAVPVIRVPGDGPGGAVGSIVTAPEPGSPLDEPLGPADEQEHLVTDPEPEALLPDERIDQARAEQPLLADGDEDVPPAPEPTFGTVPDPEAAAEAPVPVATPLDTGPEEVLPIPQRAPAEGGPPEPVASESSSEPITPEPPAKPGSTSSRAAKATSQEPADGPAEPPLPAEG